jgi:hypothetical protein
MEKGHKINIYAWFLETHICSGKVHYTGSWRVLHGFQAWEAAQRGLKELRKWQESAHGIYTQTRNWKPSI